MLVFMTIIDVRVASEMDSYPAMAFQEKTLLWMDNMKTYHVPSPRAWQMLFDLQYHFSGSPL